MVVLRCGLGNGTSPILYEWEHERPGTPVTTIARGNSSMLIMSNVNRNNTGWYRCVVSNAVNLERSDRALMDVVCESPLFGNGSFIWEGWFNSDINKMDKTFKSEFKKRCIYIYITAKQGSRIGAIRGCLRGCTVGQIGEF